MVIGILKLELHIPASNSLKHKRMIMNSLKGRLRNKFNISTAEIDCHEKWQRTVIAVCQVSSDTRRVHKTMDSVLKFVESFNGVEVLNNDMEML